MKLVTHILTAMMIYASIANKASLLDLFSVGIGAFICDALHGHGGRAFLSHSIATSPIMAGIATIIVVAVLSMASIVLPTTIVVFDFSNAAIFNIFRCALIGVLIHLAEDMLTENGIYLTPRLRVYVLRKPFDSVRLNVGTVIISLMLLVIRIATETWR